MGNINQNQLWLSKTPWTTHPDHSLFTLLSDGRRYRSITSRTNRLTTKVLFSLLGPSDIWTLTPHKLSQHHPQSGWREIAASASYLFIYLFIYLQVAWLWFYLSWHLFVPYNLHCVQLLLLKINCTSKLAIKMPILFYSILCWPPSLQVCPSPKRSESCPKCTTA